MARVFIHLCLRGCTALKRIFQLKFLFKAIDKATIVPAKNQAV